jgi:hypothetical protein
MRVRLLAVAVATLLASSAQAQAPVRVPDNQLPIGTWRGTSLCLVRPSPCHDEVVVYRITRSSGDSVALDARKIVRGQEEEMGVLTCGVAPTGSPDVALTCAMRNGVWNFRVRGDSLVGELRLPDGSKFRDVRTVRAR